MLDLIARVRGRVFREPGPSKKPNTLVGGATGQGPFSLEEVLHRVPGGLKEDFELFISKGDISPALAKAMDTDEAIQKAVEMAFATKSREFEDFARALQSGDDPTKATANERETANLS
jgi:hypothetical protein